MSSFSRHIRRTKWRLLPWALLSGLLLSGVIFGRPLPRNAARRAPWMKASSAVSPHPQVYGYFKSRVDNGPYAKVILRNDLDLLIKEHHGTPLASITILVRARGPMASADAELIQRLAVRALFPPEIGITATASNDSMALLGGDVSFSTTPDFLRFTLTLPANNLGKAYPLLARRLLAGPMDDTALSSLLTQLRSAQEKGRMDWRSHEEFLLAGDAASRVIPAQPSTELLQSLNRYLKRVVNAAHIVITVVGDVDRESVIRGVSDAFLPLPSVETKSALPKPAEPVSSSLLQYNLLPSPDGLAGLSVYFPVKSISPAAADVLSGILSDGRMSVLGHDLVYRRPAALSISSGSVTVRGMEYFAVHLTCRAEQLDKTSVLLFAKLRQFSESEPTADELLRARKQFELRWYLENRSPADIGVTLARLESGPGYLTYTKTLSSLDSVTANAIRQLVKEMAETAHPIVFELWPSGYGTRTFTSQTYRDFLDLAVPRAYAQLGRRLEQAGADLASVKVTPSPYVGNFDRSQVKPAPWNRYSILRGPNVYVSEDHLVPLVTIEALYSGGQIMESRDHAGMTALMVQTAIESLNHKTSDELWFHLEAMGATLFPIVKGDLYGYGLIVPSSVAESAIDLLMEMVLNPQFTPDEVAQAKAYLLERWKAHMETTERFSQEKLEEAFFVHTTLFPPVPDRIAVVQKASEKDVKKWWENLQSDTPPTLMVLGDTEGTEMVSPFARKLSSSKWNMKPLVALTSIKTPKLPALVQETHTGTPAPILQMSFGGPGFGSPNADSMEFAQTLFKGTFDQSSVGDFYYLRLFNGSLTEAGAGNPSSLSDAAWKHMAELIASDTALNAARTTWITDQTLRDLNPTYKGIDFYRRSLYSPGVEATQKAMLAVSQWSNAQWRAALQSIFNTQNLIACYTTPAVKP